MDGRRSPRHTLSIRFPWKSDASRALVSEILPVHSCTTWLASRECRLKRVALGVKGARAVLIVAGRQGSLGDVDASRRQ